MCMERYQSQIRKCHAWHNNTQKAPIALLRLATQSWVEPFIHTSTCTMYMVYLYMYICTYMYMYRQILTISSEERTCNLPFLCSSQLQILIQVLNLTRARVITVQVLFTRLPDTSNAFLHTSLSWLNHQNRIPKSHFPVPAVHYMLFSLCGCYFL